MFWQCPSTLRKESEAWRGVSTDWQSHAVLPTPGAVTLSQPNPGCCWEDLPVLNSHTPTQLNSYRPLLPAPSTGGASAWLSASCWVHTPQVAYAEPEQRGRKPSQSRCKDKKTSTLRCLKGALHTQGLPQHHCTHLETATSKYMRWRVKTLLHGLLQVFLAKAEKDLLCPVLAKPKLLLFSTTYFLCMGLMFTALPWKAVGPRVLRPEPRHCNASTPAGLLPPHVTLTQGHWLSGVWLCFGAWIAVIRSLSQWIWESSCQQLLSRFIIMEIQPSILLIAFSFASNFCLHFLPWLQMLLLCFLLVCHLSLLLIFCSTILVFSYWKILSISTKSQCKSFCTFLHIVVCFSLDSRWRSFPSCQNHF